MVGLAVVGVLAAVVVVGVAVSAWVIRHSPRGNDDVSFLDLMDGANQNERELP